ncbi:GNAT family N-acetyltransferase [Hyphobacterium sp. HN65]|uniref:GNAT family N-acetyltransferase n=1 Tax=Hyphobacterium lacteum TaxID=3116575 RepID=A0ABU7LNR0_9PROT|nr:GNAT family N-acetyltransferase [Hyphobacterium sp. HN65]MEE2525550.1 GNAT family N-acetyltransferase [Hyphobacterium sp. HN65]
MSAGDNPQTKSARIVIRNAEAGDIDDIIALQKRAFPKMEPDSPGMIRGRLERFPEGQFVVELDGELAGWASTFIVDEAIAFADHTLDSITGHGYGSLHNPEGDWLYGAEVAVDPGVRRIRIGQRLYDARRGLCEDWGLKGIVFGARIPSLRRKIKEFGSAEAYLEAIQEKKAKDPVLAFQSRLGFEPVRLMKDYYPEDRESLGHSVLMSWQNPAWVEDEKAPVRPEPRTIRVASVQFQARAEESLEKFERNVEYFVDVCSDYRADFCVFPEMFTVALLALEKRRLSPEESINALSRHTPRFIEFMRGLAVGYNINIIGGSHPTQTEDGDIQNVAYVFLRDGSVHAQEKIHPTPNEKFWWGIKGGDEVRTIDTDCGPIGVLICYDAEFPELARKLADEGAGILFVPYATDDRTGHLRVRYCAHARAIENQVFVATAGNVGNLPGVENMDVNYAESAIITPCDFPFARDGLAAVAAENVETIVVADVRLDDLTSARHSGTVRNLSDRRFDLYRVVWNKR